MNSGVKSLVFLVAMAATGAFAFQPIPKASARALGVTRGKSFSSGAVFVNGKFIEPPYVVERWGTGIRINQTPVTGQVVDWVEFLKTQSGFKVTKTEVAPPPEPAPAEEPAPAAAETEAAGEAAEAAGDSLDSLFEDDSDSGSDKKKSASAPAKRPSASPPPPRPKVTVSYSFEGDFVPNETTKKFVASINVLRTEIDRILRSGGFICFGDNYSRVVGDKRTLSDLLEKLPELQQGATSVEDFCTKTRAAHLDYFNEVLRWDLYKNRVDYLKLRKLRERLSDKFELLGL